MPDHLSFPLVSVIMPVRNEADFIERSLSAVLAQDYPRDRLEVLIADGMSTDETRNLIRNVSGRHPEIPVTIIDNPRKIVPTGFNLALEQARGDIIVRVDGHTIIETDYVRQCVMLLESSSADNVGGKMNAVSNTAFGESVSIATSSPFGVGGARFHYSDEEEWVDTVYMGAWRREVFDRIGLFDEEMARNQDDEHNYRLSSCGGRLLLSPRIRSEYYNRTTVASLWRQYFQYGYWKVRVMQKHPAQMRLRQFAPPALVGALLGSVLLAIRRRYRLAAIVPALYIIANLGASIVTAKQHGWHQLRRLPIIYAVLHLSYGFGFLTGLVKFWNRWDWRQIVAGREGHKRVRNA